MRITKTAAGAVLSLALALATGSSVAEAQRTVAVGVAAGVPFPLGDFRDEVNPGWRALGTVALTSPIAPLGLRLDAAFDRLGFTSTPTGAAGRSTGAQQVVSVTVNPIYRLTRAGNESASYVIGGIGAYSIRCAGVARCDGVTRAGWNTGLGTRFTKAGLRWFIEARYHHVSVPSSISVQYVPVTLGILF